MKMTLVAYTGTCTPMSVSRGISFPSKRNLRAFMVRTSAEESDCNAEECAPEKEVGKMSMEWLAEEKTQVVGTYPPRTRRGWTGYVEKDTAGQTNIYSVEPTVYISESAISSGTSGSSSEGSANTIAIAGSIALVTLAAASSVFFLANKNAPQTQVVDYKGPSLSYYINKFQPSEVVEVAAPATSDSPLRSSLPETPLDELEASDSTLPSEIQAQAEPQASTDQDSVSS